MNNTPNQESQYTEAGVRAWLASELAKLDTSGMRNVSLSITARADDGVAQLSFVGLCGDPLDCYNFSGGYGTTVQEAHANLREKIPSGAAMVAKLRADAQALADKADKLEAEAATKEVAA